MNQRCFSGKRYWNPDRILFLLFFVLSVGLTIHYGNRRTTGDTSTMIASWAGMFVSIILVVIADDRYAIKLTLEEDRLEVEYKNRQLVVPWANVHKLEVITGREIEFFWRESKRYEIWLSPKDKKSVVSFDTRSLTPEDEASCTKLIVKYSTRHKRVKYI